MPLKLPRSVCALLALHAALWALPAQAQAPALAENLLTLSATASIDVARDLLSVTLSTQREGPEAANVQAQLMKALDAALIEARPQVRPGQLELRTGNFAIYPRYAPKGGVTQWQGSVEMVIEGRDVEAITQLVGRIQTLTVAHVSHALSSQAHDKVRAEVGAMAIARFRSQAESYAKAFGFAAVSLRAVELSTNELSNPPEPMRLAARSDKLQAAEALPVEAGKASVRATVSGTVQMK